MKYTVEGFYQPSLVDAGLDVADAMILRWFIDFSESGNMKAFLNGRGTFFYVKYSAIAQELPVLGIKSSRGISKRFETYVKKGLLERETYNTTKGLMPFFRKTEKLSAMLYDRNTANPEKESNDKLKIISLVRTKLSAPEAPGNVAPERGDETTPSEGDMNDCTHGVGTAVPRGCERQFLGGRNGRGHALNKFIYQNSSITNPSTTIPSREAEEDFIKACIKKTFGGQYVFYNDFPRSIATAAAEVGLKSDDFPEFFDFALESTKNKTPKSLTNLFYTLAKAPAVMFDFLNRKKHNSDISGAKKNTMTCPVCGTEHDRKARECPGCGCRDSDRADAQRLDLFKRIYNLPFGTKQKYTEEMASLEKEFSARNILSDAKAMAEYKQAKNGIDMKYGIMGLGLSA